MSKELPYFKFHVSEWILGRISDEDDKTQGAFIVAICHYWHKNCNYFCADFQRKIGKKRYNLLKSKEYFFEENDKISIPFLDEQFLELSELQVNRSKAGKKGRAAQLGQTPGKEQANAGHLDKDKDKDKEEDKIKEAMTALPSSFPFRKNLLDYGFEERLVDDWILVRKNKKARNTETALNGFIREVEKSGRDKNEILRICVEKSWQGFTASWLKNTNQISINEPKFTKAEREQYEFDRQNGTNFSGMFPENSGQA